MTDDHKLRVKPIMPLRDRASCDTCEFGEVHESDDNHFYCRRRAPSMSHGSRAIFPLVNADDWCGEFKQETA
jgi:hypothetical protein